jgi:hypothetical protein
MPCLDVDPQHPAGVVLVVGLYQFRSFESAALEEQRKGCLMAPAGFTPHLELLNYPARFDECLALRVVE